MIRCLCCGQELNKGLFCDRVCEVGYHSGCYGHWSRDLPINDDEIQPDPPATLIADAVIHRAINEALVDASLIRSMTIRPKTGWGDYPGNLLNTERLLPH